MQKFFYVAVLALSFVGCSANKSSVQSPFASRDDVRAHASIGESFSVLETSSDVLKTDKAQITIARAALEKEFLLQASLIPQTVAPTGSNLKSRVVAFRERNDKLFLMEATQGHVVTNDLPSGLILAEFPILSSTADEITFDFNAGMAKLFLYADWTGKDFDGADYNDVNHFQSARVAHSYLESAKATAQNQLVIRQIAQIELRNGSADVNLPVEVKYYLAPYRPDPTYEAFVTPVNFDDFGYFEVAPQLTSIGSTKIFATRFNPKKPIVFAISVNTPAAHRKAVEDGVLYWNKAFGSEVVKVVPAPEGVTAPDFNYNVVQWVPWDLAGFAYADAQMDPRTGEILHAQVFMTSAFAFGGANGARRLLRRLRADGTHNHSVQLSLRGFEQKRLCNRETERMFAESLENVLAQGADDETINKVVADYIREVMAHEIGHTLGLRHNFAGSLAANYSLTQRDAHVSAYLKNKAAPQGLLTSSSVMEYQRLEEGGITGDQIVQGQVLPYDKAAIENLYLGKKFARGESPLFCTDSHAAGMYPDCLRHDYGPSPVEYWSYTTEKNIERHAQALVEWMINAKTPLPGEEAQPFEKAIPPTEMIAAAIMADRETLLKLFTDKSNLFKIHRRHLAVGGHNIDAVRAEQQSYLATEVERLGGLDKIFAMVSSEYAAQATAKVAELLKKSYASGEGQMGQKFEFSQAEIEHIKKIAASYFEKLGRELIKRDLAIMASTGLAGDRFPDSQLSNELALLMEKRMREYIMTTTGEVMMADIEVPVVATPAMPGAAGETPATSSTTVPGVAATPVAETPSIPAVLAPAPAVVAPPQTRMASVKLPVFKYPLAIRAMAGQMLRDGRSEAVEWGLSERAKVAEEFKAMLDEALTSPIEGLTPSKMPKSIARWVIENKLVLGTIGTAPTPVAAAK